MPDKPLMHARDAVYGSEAKCFVTIDERRMNFMHFTNFEGKVTINKQQVPILGKVGFGSKAAGMSGTWTATAHFNQSHFRAIAEVYQRTGVMPYFEIQVTNEDRTATVGRQTVIFHDCLVTDDIVLAKFEAGDSLLTEDISGTFEYFSIPQKFEDLEGL
ncbi:MAG: phage tail tube protein [Defluviitaleaceae bacterium]|nr:phage tail tube protein [Defluviitaleaceae bacterium]